MESTYTAANSPSRQRLVFGKHRARVVGNRDPDKLGRIEVLVEEVRGQNVTEWALPASPYAGSGVGFFAIPPVGANVWVEYEGGNLDVPIWSGCFWVKGEIASEDAVPEVLFIKTKQASIRIDASAGELTIELQGAKITLSASEAKVEAPQIGLSANGAKVELTASGLDALQGALTVR